MGKTLLLGLRQLTKSSRTLSLGCVTVTNDREH
jgi:hypothetical protein